MLFRGVLCSMAGRSIDAGWVERKTNLVETDVLGLLSEALTAEVHLQNPSASCAGQKKPQFQKDKHTPYLRMRPARWVQTRLFENPSAQSVSPVSNPRSYPIPSHPNNPIGPTPSSHPLKTASAAGIRKAHTIHESPCRT